MNASTQAVRTVPALDLDRYLGQWFEVGRLPLRWEDENSTNVTATYTLQDDGNIEVDNRCCGNLGKPSQSLGRAKPVDGEPGQLTVSFLPQFLRWIPFAEGDYWVLKVAEDYSVALVGTPDHENLWLLAREHELSHQVRDEYLAAATAQGFKLDAWITPRQDGRVVTDVEQQEDIPRGWKK